jgi:hypothetical protein
MQRTADGLGIDFTMFRNPLTNSFSSMAFIGLPCPRNSTGIVGVLLKGVVVLFIALIFIVIKLCNYKRLIITVLLFIILIKYARKKKSNIHILSFLSSRYIFKASST